MKTVFVKIIISVIVLFLSGIFCRKNVQYESLQEFDELIHSIESQLETSASFGSLMSLSVLYYLKDDQWMQGGSWKSLYYTIKSMQFMEASSELSSNRNLKFALSMHYYSLLFSLGRYKETIELLEPFYLEQKKLPRSRPHDFRLARVLYLRGDAYLSMGDIVNAKIAFEGSMKHCACFHQAYYKLAQSLSMDSRNSSELVNFLRESSEALLGKIYLDQKLQKVVYKEGVSIICETGDNEVNGIDELYKHSTIKNSNLTAEIEITPVNLLYHYRLVLSTFHFTLFHVYEIEKQYPKAWFHLQQMRSLEKFRLIESAVYNVSASIASVSRAIEHFTTDYWPRTPENWVGIRKKTPIFIVGFFRSGSTLLESLLSAHPQIWGMGENSLVTYHLVQMNKDLTSLQFPTSMDGRSIPSSNEPGPLQRKELGKIIRKWGQKIIDGMQEKYQEFYNGLSSFNDSSLPNNYSLPLSKKKITRIVDKMLFNYLNIPFIHLMFPEAVILHTVRDPLDTLFSCMKNRFGDYSVYTLEFRTLVIEYISYLEIIDHYRRILPVLHYPDGWQRKPMLDIRYEQVVANPQRVMKRIFEVLDLPTQEDSSTTVKENSNNNFIDEFHRQERHVRTASFLQVKQPIYEKSVGNWRKYSKEFQETLIPELKRALLPLKKKRALPFMKDEAGNPRMNWELDVHFNYSSMIEKLR
jgi:tetratricopeptide (TPR) repeat protein